MRDKEQTKEINLRRCNVVDCSISLSPHTHTSEKKRKMFCANEINTGKGNKESMLKGKGVTDVQGALHC